MTQASHRAPGPLDELLTQAIASIRYGVVEITIHDGRIVQIEKREKLRLAETPSSGRTPGAR